MKFLFTFLQGKLTAMGLNGLMLTEVIELLPGIATVWENGQGADVSLSGAIFAAASLWGWLRRFSKTYKIQKKPPVRY